MNAKKNNEITFKSWLIRNLFSIAAIIVAFANIWLATRLYPITQNISALANSVQLNELGVQTNTERIVEMKEDLNYIRNRVDNIYSIIR